MKKLATLYYCGIFFLLLTGKINLNAQPFQSLKDEVRKYWSEGEQQKSISLLLENKDKYPASLEQHTILYYLSLLYLETDQPVKSFTCLREGFQKKFFFSFWPAHLKKIKSYENGTEILNKNIRLRQSYLQKSKAVYEVILPKSYQNKHQYPLLYFFHGNNSNLEYLKEQWAKVEDLADVVLVLVQSNFAKSNFAFDWLDKESSIVEIQRIYEEVIMNISINSNKIIVGGFSNGARMAINLFLEQTFPLAGFLALNPSFPKNFHQLIVKAPPKGRGVILSAEKDYLISDQIEMAHIFLKQKFPLRLVIQPDQGHDYPMQFEKEILSSLNFILK